MVMAGLDSSVLDTSVLDSSDLDSSELDSESPPSPFSTGFVLAKCALIHSNY